MGFTLIRERVRLQLSLHKASGILSLTEILPYSPKKIKMDLKSLIQAFKFHRKCVGSSGKEPLENVFRKDYIFNRGVVIHHRKERGIEPPLARDAPTSCSPKSYDILFFDCAQSYPALCDTMDCVPVSMEFSRQEYWSELPYPSPGNLPDPGIKPKFPALQVDSLPLSHQGSPPGI